ncbi:MAG: hypothetical protein HW386_566 [Gammaproteobacteria bacterium]|nr:hypothetical protein [Gammaproteobacteria bacterium]
MKGIKFIYQNILKTTAVLTGLFLMFNGIEAMAYPPAVGLLGEAENCLKCHVNNGPWEDDERLIIDILDKETQKSLKQGDCSFLIEAKRGELKTILTVIGRKGGNSEEIPYRNAWLYVDPNTIATSSLTKFAPGWNVNLPMSCRIIGDNLESYKGTNITVLPMSVRPTDTAINASLSLQVMLTKGESKKGKPEEGMIGNYFERIVNLKVNEE